MGPWINLACARWRAAVCAVALGAAAANVSAVGLRVESSGPTQGATAYLSAGSATFFDVLLDEAILADALSLSLYLTGNPAGIQLADASLAFGADLPGPGQQYGEGGPRWVYSGPVFVLAAPVLGVVGGAEFRDPEDPDMPHFGDPLALPAGLRLARLSFTLAGGLPGSRYDLDVGLEYDFGGATLTNATSITAMEVVPEPGTAALFFSGLVLLGAIARRRTAGASGTHRRT